MKNNKKVSSGTNIQVSNTKKTRTVNNSKKTNVSKTVKKSNVEQNKISSSKTVKDKKNKSVNKNEVPISTGTRIVKVKVKRRRFKVKKILSLIIFMFCLYGVFQFLNTLSIKNIVIVGNELLLDYVIIEDLNLDDYPSFYLSSSSGLEKELLKNDLVKSVNVNKNILKRKLTIEVEEKKLLFSYNGEIVLEDGSKIESENYVTARLINKITDPYYDMFIEGFASLDYEIIKLVSEIEYIPNDVDNERFILTMVDGNDVYMTISKINEVNNYLILKEKVGEVNGIFHLDSGNYFEKG